MVSHGRAICIARAAMPLPGLIPLRNPDSAGHDGRPARILP